MNSKLLIAIITVNAVISQLLLRRASRGFNLPIAFHNMSQLVGAAARSPLIYASMALQILGYVLWLALISSEKLGVATAGVGGGFYILMSLSAWLFLGEALSAPHWVGIILITFGVLCFGLKPT